MIPKTFLSLIACATFATAQEPAADRWEKASAVSVEMGGVLFLDSAARTEIRGVTPAGTVDLKIDWLAENGEMGQFQAPTALKDGRIQSTCRIGTTTITRTLLTGKNDKAVFIHFLADQPGALSFRVSLGTSPPSQVRIEDRRQLIASPAESGPSARLWVLPFEAEVKSEGQSIVVRGEGEAMIVLNFSKEKSAEQTLSQTLSNLGTLYNPGHFPPDPTRIWQGVLKARTTATPDLPDN